MVKKQATQKPAQQPADAETETPDITDVPPLSLMDLKGSFLLAMPALGDEGPFSHALIYICEHNADGTLGIVVNRQTNLSVAQLFDGAGMSLFDKHWHGVPVYWGGPVCGDRGFILHRPVGGWQSTLEVSEEIGMTTSRDVLEAMGRGEGPDEVLVSLGYAGWSAGQLEQELAQNAWLTIPGENAEKLLFQCASEARIHEAMRRLGVDPLHFSGDAGHA
ncbi:MAG: YqgE/AlgH family protein [Proteobacteria bacterium]|nr:YqgE/AlgH family protein [Pseudomonadota bacterium]MCL2307439.1 YqgE/AlgH family protein [Pseudomonadota bacterium]